MAKLLAFAAIILAVVVIDIVEAQTGVRSGDGCFNGCEWARDSNGASCVCARAQQRFKRTYGSGGGGRYYGGHGHGGGGSRHGGGGGGGYGGRNGGHGSGGAGSGGHYG